MINIILFWFALVCRPFFRLQDDGPENHPVGLTIGEHKKQLNTPLAAHVALVLHSWSIDTNLAAQRSLTHGRKFSAGTSRGTAVQVHFGKSE